MFRTLKRHAWRMLTGLLLLIALLLNTAGFIRIPLLDRLEEIAYDTRLKLLMPNTVDHRIVIVDDGSGPSFAEIFESLRRHPQVTLLRHDVNRGKGEALKTGLFHLLQASDCAGAVTADADGRAEVALPGLDVPLRLVLEPAP